MNHRLETRTPRLQTDEPAASCLASGVTGTAAPARRRFLARASMLTAAFALAACTHTPPTGIEPVTGFDLERYLGRWFEIARLDHSFERGLTNVSANYARRDDGGITVINRGFDPAKSAWREATGKAFLLGSAQRASLKVSFFGPFYGGYHVVDLDQDGYRWALVIGPSRDYLWILAREPVLPVTVRGRLLARIRELGIDPDKLIWVPQSPGR
jgi:apolipoprotein D and lipocalin family protein